MGRTPSVAMTSAAVRSSTRNWRPARPWKRRAVEKSKSRLSHRAWKSRKVRGIPTFPPPRRLREINQNRTFHLLSHPDISCANDKVQLGACPRQSSSATLMPMELHFTPEQEAQLAQIATKEGTDPARLVKDAALRLLEEDARFRAAVREGIAQAD